MVVDTAADTVVDMVVDTDMVTVADMVVDTDMDMVADIAADSLDRSQHLFNWMPFFQFGFFDLY